MDRASATVARSSTAAAHAAAPQPRIAFFGHDSNESTVAKRVGAFQACGARVLGFMFVRPRGSPARSPGWENICLGTTIDRNYMQRVPKLLRALIEVYKARARLAGCGIFYARNIDMLCLAVAARLIARSKAVLAYEVLDVQRIFVGDRVVSRLFRWVERTLLRRCDVLVVSSPDFLSHYFEPYQHYQGATFLLENKVWPGSYEEPSLPAKAQRPSGPPWVIGWFGTLRCVRSLRILCHVADVMGDRVQIHIRGRTSEEDLKLSEIEEAAARRPNVIFGGPYVSPDDLPNIYGAVHLSWCVDYLDAGSNSDWLLPNRIYEGGLYGALALARRETATGRMVEREGLGWALAEPLEDSVLACLRAMDEEAYRKRSQFVASLPRRLFVDETDTRALLEIMNHRANERACSSRATT